MILGPVIEKHQGMWAVLTDKVYQGSVEFCRAIYPKKKQKTAMFSMSDEAENKKHCSDRIIVENVFGRMCTLWNVMSAKNSWNEPFYDPLAGLCVSLTNYHIVDNPLRATDGVNYQKLKNLRYDFGNNRAAEKRRLIQKMNREKRKQRMSVALRNSLLDDM